MADNDGQERTEQPSEKRLREGREKGQVAKSMEINSFVIFTTGLILVYFSKNFISSRISNAARDIFSSLNILDINASIIQSMALNAAIYFFITILPILIGLVLVAFVANIVQVGFKFSSKILMPSFDKFNPVTGFKKILFSSRSLVEVLKSLVKLFFIGFFTYLVIKDFISASSNLASLTISEIVSFMVDASFSLLWKIALVYLVIAASDFAYQKYKHMTQMKMTKQEVKEENKQQEGDPQIKSRIKREQYKMAKNRMMNDVPTADVVITNPTHFAVAIKYEPDKFDAPRVVAKGMDEVAQRIKKLATENNVPLYEDILLARTLYKLCGIGDAVPEALFKSVAQILAYIYKLKSNKKKSIV